MICQTTDEANIERAKKTAPMPNLSEVKDGVASGGTAPGHQDGHGHEAPRTSGEKKGTFPNNNYGKAGPHPVDEVQDIPAIRR
jgi:hypothetical protein